MSDKPELTGLQLWILQAQREILLKADLGRESHGSKSETPMTPEAPIIKMSR
jgi:hypothetical protein